MKKRTDVDRCVRAYQEGLDAYAALEKNIRAAESATAEVPLRIPSVRDARKHLAEAFPILSKLGEALAFLPALAIQLTEARRISGTFRRQAREKGVRVRYEDEDGEDWSAADTDRTD